ncbi:stalk domain-containing protein [Cohnella sp. GCM10012308]|uniref:stalk domain-containing protein n=1 Tax=Cohnella sp. GCM10012308 TaxID=3317329 RepID=UPI003615EA8B
MTIFEKGSWLALTAAFAALTASAIPTAAATDANAQAASEDTPVLIVDPAPDVARLDLVRHEMKIRLDGSGAALDGKAVATAKPILKDGRVYVALRTLSQSGAVSAISWDPKKKQVHVTANAKINPGLTELNFRMGSDRLYDGEGNMLPDYYTAPKPFIANGVAYVPVKALTWLGLSAATADGQVVWNWSEKLAQVMRESWDTNEAETTFTVLYRKELYAPQLMASTGAGSWSGGTDGSQVIAKDIEIDGNLYNRIRFTVQLHPGINILQAAPAGSSGAEFKVVRHVDDPSAVPVNLTEEAQSYLTVEAPASGFVETKAGTPIAVAGKVRDPHNLGFDKVTFVIQKYSPQGSGFAHQVYEKVGKQDIAIKDGAFNGTITLKEAGSYWIAINSPAKIPFPGSGGLVSIQWADFFVEAK